MIPLKEIEAAAELVHRTINPTPQICWPLLSKRCGTEVWVKHENHTPIGAFKVRGGITYVHELLRSDAKVDGVITATRGNHGQSVAMAARAANLPAVVVAPHGNSREKNAAMAAFGAELVEHGDDFQEAAEYAVALAEKRNLHMVPSFHPWLIKGVASYCLEFLSAVADLDEVYVPVGQGSGICSMIVTRDALELKTRIVGVVAEGAPMYALSFAAGKAVSTPTVETMADGVACRVPTPEALEVILEGADRIAKVSDDQIKAAMRHYFTDTHNIAEGAGAAPLAALLRESAEGRALPARVGLVLSGGNIDREVYQAILSEN